MERIYDPMFLHVFHLGKKIQMRMKQSENSTAQIMFPLTHQVILLGFRHISQCSAKNSCQNIVNINLGPLEATLHVHWAEYWS